jgi:hypothetical protein
LRSANAANRHGEIGTNYQRDRPCWAKQARNDGSNPPRFIEQFELAKQATCKGANGCAKTFMLPQHSHMSEVYAINTDDARLTDQILEFVKAGK